MTAGRGAVCCRNDENLRHNTFPDAIEFSFFPPAKQNPEPLSARSLNLSSYKDDYR
jgi:hypothetical protein